LTLSSQVERKHLKSSFQLFGGIGRRRDYALTFLTEFATLASTLLALKLAAMSWGASGFGEYMLARRTLSLLQLPILCGMGVAVTRYVARARAGHNPVAEHVYFTAGSLVAVITALVAALILNLVPGPLAALFFGSPDHTGLVRALSLMIIGIALHGVAYGMFRGQVAMGRANFLQAINLGVIPVAVLLPSGLTVVQVVTVTGVLWCLIAGLAVVITMRPAPNEVWNRSLVRAAAGELLRYGGPRIPGEFALGALFALPVTLAAHYDGLAAAGFVGLGVSVLTMIGSLFAPLGQIVLPAVSALSVGKRGPRLSEDTWRLTGLCLGIAGALTLGVEVGAPFFIPRLFGPEFTPAVPIIRIMSIAAVPLVAYTVLRNVLDALHESPLNANNMVVSLGVFLLLVLAIDSGYRVPIALTAGLFVLGALSVIHARRELARVGEHDVGRTL
jgi:O-antigen/teichoic acid export membrane protein